MHNLNVIIKYALALLILFASYMAAFAEKMIQINEFCASNKSTLTAANGNAEDWIELRNLTDHDINLAGWCLTDSPQQLTKFQFPKSGNILIRANNFFLIYASGSDIPLVNGEWHANFSLSKSGEYLALVNPDGEIEDEISPNYPEQYTDISYGVIGNYSADTLPVYGYFESPTPRRPNGTSTTLHGRVTSAEFNQEHGFCTSPFFVALSCEDPDAQIFYTLDGNTPTAKSFRYTSPLRIASTTVLRTVAIKDGYLPSAVRSRTWIFIDDVLKQNTMRRAIVNNTNYKNRLKEGLQEIPTISLTTDRSNLYGSSGIFDNYSQSGEAWERPASIELIDPNGGEGFEINAGIRIRGAVGRSSPKKSLRFIFGSKYDGDLNYPLFGTEGASSFSKVDLRAEQNNAWSSNVDAPWQNTFIREVFSRDTQRDMGRLYTRSRYYHLYINGVYWGLYQTMERAEADFASSYQGGDPDEWDALKSSSQRIIEVKDGTNEAYNQFYQYAKQGFTGLHENNYWIVKGMNADGTHNPNFPILLDEGNLIDYILITLYTADMDSPLSWINVVNNVSTVYHRTNPIGFQWLKHDAELSLGAFLSVEDSIGYFKNSTYWSSWNNFNPMDLHRKLIQNSEYYQKFIDGAQKRYLNNGVFSYENSLNRWNERAQVIDKSVVAESARWGNQWRGQYTYEDWKSACHLVTDSFLVGREYEMIPLLRKYNWFPALNAPLIQKEGTNNIIQVKADGPVYITLDGSDPRLPGGSLNPSAIELVLSSSSPELEEETILSEGELWRCFDTGDAPATQRNHSTEYWNGRFYNDYTWDLKSPAEGFHTASAYLRKSIVLETVDDIESAQLALLKGSGTISINGTTVKPGTFSSNILRQGRNLITVSVSDSSPFDITITVKRNISYWKEGILTLSDQDWLKARTFKDGVWSALSEIDNRNINNHDCSALKITEMMYSPVLTEEDTATGYSRDDFAWIELQNTGTKWINLEGVTFTSGIEYTFPNYLLAPNSYLVLAKNANAFATRYGTNTIQLLSGYKSNLARKGELITLTAKDGTELVKYTYSNSWYPETDRGGYSLVVIDPNAEESLWSTPENWEPSLNINGTPGNSKNGSVEPPDLMAPVIIVHPANQYVQEGGNITFQVVASGSAPLHYQWYKDGEIIPNEINPLLILSGVTSMDAGSYHVTVSNNQGIQTSNTASLNILEAGNYANAILFHRYGFDSTYEDADMLMTTDSVSHADATLYGSAKILDGYLSLDGSGDRSSFTNGCFVALPPELIANFTSFTVEMWARATAYNGSWMRLFDFGNCTINADNTIGNGQNYTMMTWSSGGDMRDGVRLNGVEQVVTSPVLPVGDGVFHHIVYVYDAQEKTGFIYTDGVQTGKAPQEFNPTQWGGCPNMWIGKSQFSADPYFSGDFDEFRIYKGTLSEEEVRVNYVQGPTMAESSPIIVSQPSSLILQEGKSCLLEIIATGTNPLSYQWYKDGNAIPGATESTFYIPEVSVPDAGNYYVIVTNSIGNKTSETATLNIKEKTAYENAVLLHRYSFDEEYDNGVVIAKDSISGANGTLYGSAMLKDGYLSLDGSGDTKSFTNGCFVALPPELIANFTSFSVEMWARANVNKGNWMRLFDFGNCSTNDNNTIGSGKNYTMMTWSAGRDMRDGVRLNGVEQVVTAPVLPIGDSVFHHIVYVYDAQEKTGTIYSDGVQTGKAPQEFNPTQWGGCPNMWIGKSQWSADPYFAGDFDEFRIYEGTLSAEEIAQNNKLGADEIIVLPSKEPALSYTFENGELILNFVGYLEYSDDLISWKKLPSIQSPYTVPKENITQRFYRSSY